MSEQYTATVWYDERASKLRKSLYILWVKLLLLRDIKVEKFKVIDHLPTPFYFGIVLVVATGVKRKP